MARVKVWPLPSNMIKAGTWPPAIQQVPAGPSQGQSSQITPMAGRLMGVGMPALLGAQIYGGGQSPPPPS